MERVRKDRDRIVKYLCINILLVLAVLSVLQISVCAQEKTEKTIRIAYPVVEGSQDEMAEYTHDFFDKLSEYTGWNLEYITFDDMTQDEAIMKAMEMVQNGEADMMGGLLKNSATEKMFLFPKESYGSVYTTLCTLEDSRITKYHPKNEEDSLRVAVYDKAEQRNNEVISYLEDSESSYELIKCSSVEEQLEALKEGRADVMSNVSSQPIYNTRCIARFAPRSYYIVVTPGNQALADEIDAGIRNLLTAQPFYLDNLANQHYGKELVEFDIDAVSKDILPDDGVIHVLGMDGDAPYFFLNEEKKPAGFMYELLTGFADATGQKIEFDICNTITEREKMIQEKEYDLLIGSPFCSNNCVKMGFIQSTPVAQESMSEIYHVGEKTDKKIRK